MCNQISVTWSNLEDLIGWRSHDTAKRCRPIEKLMMQQGFAKWTVHLWAIMKPHSGLWLLHGNLTLRDEYMALVTGQWHLPIYLAQDLCTSVQNTNGTRFKIGYISKPRNKHCHSVQINGRSCKTMVCWHHYSIPLERVAQQWFPSVFIIHLRRYCLSFPLLQI